MRKSYKKFQESRSSAIHISQEALRLSKRAIFYLHQEKNKDANSSLKDAEKELQQLQKIWKKIPKLRYEGCVRAALEEYIEARTYYQFIVNGKLKLVKEFDPESEEIVAGLADFTGELVRYAVTIATQGNAKKVDQVQKVVESVVEELLNFHLTGHLRQKFDEAKRNLHRIEDIRFKLNV
ncbi:hypothetical protein ACFL0L_01940 [Patescibacteria group bacterium]